MSRRRKSLNLFQHLYRFITLLLNSLSRAVNLLTKGLLKTIQRRLPRQRNRRPSTAGFVLPTIVMVSLVVVLVTTAVMIRSFDRSRNASNFRVNETVLNAATPALDRARAKITRLFSGDETNLPVGTPKDEDIRTAFEKGLDNYTFQDEDKLELSISGRNSKLKTAWRYPVDSNNNGKFDSYTLYGIYFNDPTAPSDKDFNQGSTTSRTPLDARSAPMDDGQSSSCSSASGSEGSWRKTGSGVLKKAFFTYVATVPISEDQAKALGSNYEKFVGNEGFSALEMQQDQSRLNLDNNAVFYQDDLEVSYAPKFFINGRVHTNGNLLVSAAKDFELVFLQVSSPYSCFYKPENSAISVGGNVAAGGIFEDADGEANAVKTHLFIGPNQDPTDLTDRANSANGIPAIDGNRKTTEKTGGREVAYNDQAYQERLRVLTSGALNLFDTDPSKWESATSDQVSAITRFPQEVKDSFKQKYTSQQQQPTLLRTTLEAYFAKRIRRVPFAEISVNGTPDTYAKVGSLIATEKPTESGAGKQFVFTLSPDVNGVITPPKQWMLIEDPNSGDTSSYTKLNLRYLDATDPTLVDPQTKRNDYIGDRVLVGNNLPYQWFNDKSSTVGTTKSKQFAKANAERPVLSGAKWLQPLPGGGSAGTIQRSSRIVVLDDIADTGRGGFWEVAASSNKTNIQLPDGTTTFATDDTRGGLRVITGAGIYIDGCPTEAPTGGFSSGFPCNGTKGLGLRESDTKATATTTRSFLPQPPQFQADPDNTGAYRLSLSPPNAADTSTTSTTPSVAGEDRVRVKLPAISGATLLTDEKPITVWSDAMPMWQDRNLDGKWDIPDWHKSGLTLTDIQDSTGYKLDLKGDLQMRASVVYHYNSPTPDVPLACVSSYYDPSNINSANASDGLALTTDRRANTKSATPSVAGNTTKATNGRSYSFDASWQNPSGDDLTILQRQAAMVFPDGRLVNEPLRTALLRNSASIKLTIADQAAIDAAMCSLKILDGTATASSSAVPNGAVKEATLVDARQIKAIHKINYGGTSAPSTTSDADAKVNGLTSLSNPDRQKIAQTSQELTLSSGASNLYNLPIEQRQPLEVRVTELDIQLLRTTKVGSGTASGANDNQEYLLPNSGIIYASRDDALPDLTSVNDSGSPDANTGYRTLATMNKTLADKASATDFKLDATRNPNGIRLIRGSNISRQSSYRQPEKGLTLATNIPVYLRADSNDAFNLHAAPNTTNTIEEFNEAVNLNNDADKAGNFYTRGKNDTVNRDRNTNFACRSGQNGCGGTGDQWRAARIIADSITLLSNNFYDGVRSDSGFDQNNNGGNYLVEPRLKNGFLWNGFGTSSEVANVVTPDSTRQSSYWTNGVTPIQRRVSGAPVYKMEICLKLPVVACQPQDWKQAQVVGTGSTAITINAGTTATLPDVTPSTPERLQSIYRLPRRVAFDRNTDGTLILRYPDPSSSKDNIVLGSTSDNKKLITIKADVSATGVGIIPIQKYDLLSDTSLSDPSKLVAQPSPQTSSATGPSILWFGSGSQQKLILNKTYTAFDSDTIPTDFKANSGSTSYYQQYVPPTSTTNKGVALPQFFPAFNDIPGATTAISTISDASKYSFCIARPPSTSTDQPATGSGASQQVIVRTQVLSSGTPAYVPGNAVPTAAQSTLPIPLTTDPFPALAIKPFEPYTNPFYDTTTSSSLNNVYTSTAWNTAVTGYTGSYAGKDTLGATTATTNGFAFCATATADALDTFRKALVDPASPATGDIVFSNFTTAPTTGADLVTLVPPTSPATSPTLVTITAKALASGVTATTSSVTYIDLAAVSSTATPPTPSIPNGTKITLQAGTGTSDSLNPIFIFRGLTDDGIVLGNSAGGDGVQVYLKGVDPNNVFWVSKRGITINDANATAAATVAAPYPEFKGHLLVGNFLGNNNVLTATASDTGLSPLQIGNNTKVTAGRFLGFTSSNLRDALPASGGTVPPGSAPPAKTMELWAMNSVPPTYQKYTNQPIMAPVLNIHSPSGTPSKPFGTSSSDRLDGSGWIPAAKNSTFNAVLVMGDSPARPIDPTEMGSYTGEAAEGNGGLVNFPRFLERWEDSSSELNVNIAGSLIQYKKSVYADAPYELITNPSVDNSLFFDSPDYTAGFTGSPGFTGYRYPGGGNVGRSPYYISPNRVWGFDVGLLSQPADLFSKRFSLPSTARPSEFFREVSRDDTWVKALLCGKVAGTSQTAVDSSQLPSSCS